MKRQKLWSIGVASAVLAVGGCSSSDGSSADTSAPSTTEATDDTTPSSTEAPAETTPETTEAPATTTPTTPEPTAPATTTPLDEPPLITIGVVDDGDVTPEIAADKATARTALFTLADFPAGWVETPKDPEQDDADSQRFDQMIDDCLGEAGAFDDSFTKERKVETGDFGVDSSSIEANQEVILAPSEDDAIGAITKIGNEAVPACFAQATQAVFDETLADPSQTDFPPGMTVGTVEVEFLDYGYADDEAVVLFAHIPAMLDDTAVDVYIETWYIRSGRALSQIQFTGTNELFPQDGIDELTAIALDRIAQIA